MEIQSVSVDDPRWLTFISACPEASAFHHPAWIRLLSDCYGYRPTLLAVVDGGEVVGGLPLAGIRSRITGGRLVALPFTDYCQPLVRGELAEAKLMDGVRHLVEAERWPRAEVRWPWASGDGIQPGEQVARHVTRLSSDPEQVRRRFKSSVNRLIRQAEGAGLTVSFGESWDDLRAFYDLHLETRRRQGTPVQPLRFFHLLWDRLLAQGLGFVLLAWKDGRAVSAAVFLNWNQTLIYKYGASLPEYWNLRPNNLLFWSAIKWACEHGYNLLDWGKTDVENEGLRAFKRGWAAEESLLSYSIVSSKPYEAAGKDNSRYLKPVIQRSPAWVGRAIGELLYGHFG